VTNSSKIKTFTFDNHSYKEKDINLKQLKNGNVFLDQEGKHCVRYSSGLKNGSVFLDQEGVIIIAFGN
jgi:hypothetical protein